MDLDLDAMRNLLEKYYDVFRIHVGSDLPVQIKPMTATRHESGTKIRVRPRRYSYEQLAFLDKKLKELIDLGLIYKSLESSGLVLPSSFQKRDHRNEVLLWKHMARPDI